MIFPFVDEEELENISTNDDYTIPREYEIDFETGQLTGRIVEGLDAVIVWVWLALQTARGRYYIYSNNYGQDFDTLVGSPFGAGFVEAELQRIIEECLLYNEYIQSVDDFIFDADENGEIIVQFKITTMFGEVSTDVRGDYIRLYAA